MSALLQSLARIYAGRLITASDDMAPFLTDWRHQWCGKALAVALPATTQEVSRLVAWCAQNAVPIVPQGGNTGLSGGAVPDESGTALVISLTRMNAVRAVDLANGTITAEAGCVLAAVQAAAAAADRLFPLSLGAEGSCTIGGNLATNAGGTGVLRYGNARELCLGIEVVTASGEIWNGLRGLRKDNSGYDLRDLFIGAEGTLGIITAAVLKLFPRPSYRTAAFVALPSPAAAVALLSLAQQRLGPSLSAFELISDSCVTLVTEHFAALRKPIAIQEPWYVLMEISTIDGDDAQARLEAALSEALEQGLVTDASIAASDSQTQAFWALRENITEAQGQAGKAIKHDISVPISAIPAFIDGVSHELESHIPAARLIIFGHIGDGNLHFNLSPAKGQEGREMLADIEAINHIVHDGVVRHGGSISAEHGLGILRRDEAARYKQPVELAMMRAIKYALDPQGLMNPGKVLAAEPMLH